MIRAFFAGAVALLLSGCATIVSGTSQDISVNTNPPGANCALNRQGEKIGQVSPTPGVAKVDKTRDDITLVCDRDGYQEATYIIRSGLETATIGNVFIGGLVGVGIDAATGANNHYDSPANVTLVPAVASAAPASHDASQSTPSVATARAKANAPAAVQAPVTVAALNVGSTASASPSSAAVASTNRATAESLPKPAPGTWTAKLHWIPTLLAPRFSGTGESMLAYDVALTNVSMDANKLSISSEKNSITGTVAGGTIELNGWYKDPWGNVNSVHGSLTEKGGAFTGEETCYNTQLAKSAPTSQMTPHYCKIELSQVQ